MPRPLALLLTILALALSSCGEDAAQDGEAPPADGAATTSTEAPAAAPDAGAGGDCVKKEEPGGGGKALPCPTPTLIEGKENVVTFKTSEGSFEITLDAERAPATANSVAYLTEKRFYDGLNFHRVVPEFVIQGGDPLGDGTGGPGYSVTEAPPSDLTYTRGVVAMAKGGADSPGASGSQFFVVSAADVGLPPEYALVGKVSQGLGTVDKITALGEGDGPPRKEVEITSATLSGR
ncbi:MAG: peptidylprolyl isomerase [Actinomycetota bacterium]|nr:peptidylprolyl isomerase [Actinomycetota bacterium]